MKISIKVGTSEPFVITKADDRTAPLIKGYHIGETRNEQVAGGLRWTEAEVINRDNQLVQVTFQCEITHASEAAAEEYLLLWSATRPKSGDVIFETLGNGGGTVTTLKGATIICPDSWYEGCVTFHQYLLRGGKIEKV